MINAWLHAGKRHGSFLLWVRSFCQGLPASVQLAQLDASCVGLFVTAMQSLCVSSACQGWAQVARCSSIFCVPGAAAAKFTGSGGAIVVLCHDGAQEKALHRVCCKEGWSLRRVSVGPPNFASIP